DGSRLALLCRSLSSEHAIEYFIETVARDGSQRRVVVRDQQLLQDGGEVALGWAPDGRLIFGTAHWPPEEPGTTLWSVLIDGKTGTADGPRERIDSWTTNIGSPVTVSARGTVAILQYQAQLDVYVADILQDGKRIGTPSRLTMTERDERPA